MDDDPSLLFGYLVDPIHVVESLPLTYDNRLDGIERGMYYSVIGRVCVEGRVDLIEKLLNGEYIGINEVICAGVTLLGVARSIDMAEFLINRGAVFRGGGRDRVEPKRLGKEELDCFGYYITHPALHILNHFFNHPQFIYRDSYMEVAIDLGTITLKYHHRDREPIIGEGEDISEEPVRTIKYSVPALFKAFILEHPATV